MSLSSNHHISKKSNLDRLRVKIDAFKKSLLSYDIYNYLEIQSLVTDGYFISKIAFDYANAEDASDLRKIFFEHFIAINKDINTFCQMLLNECKYNNYDIDLEYKFYEVRSRLCTASLYADSYDSLESAFETITQAQKELRDIAEEAKSLPENRETLAIIDTNSTLLKALELKAILRFNFASDILSRYRSGKNVETMSIVIAFSLLNHSEDSYYNLKCKKQCEAILKISLDFPNDLLNLIKSKKIPHAETVEFAFSQLEHMQRRYHFLPSFAVAAEAQDKLQEVKEKIKAYENTNNTLFSTAKLSQQIPINNKISNNSNNNTNNNSTTTNNNSFPKNTITKQNISPPIQHQNIQSDAKMETIENNRKRKR